jgi:cysteine synthase
MPDIHSRTTAPEILAAFEGERLDYWVTGFGTGGTLKGVARVLKASGRRPDRRVRAGQLAGARQRHRPARRADGAPAPAIRFSART